MRLLHSKTLELAEFTERGLPPYVILSHTWENEEVSFQEMRSHNSTGKKGYTKIRKCCAIAAAAGFEYVWVDTCCIDKTSSAELTEAINSMYLWYQKADVCYVYMADYHGLTSLGRPLPSFRNSRWFKRGWTLQELIAPESVIFCNSQWTNIGTKHSLREEISEITEIQVEALLGAKLEDFSVAQRMCWASRRETTRIEDEAYSLLGIFDVHMPMLYGEGSHAFIRLQEEIIKRSTDHTIFAWAHGFPEIRNHTGGLLADCPSAFVNTKFIVQDLSTEILPFEITNKGVHLHLPIYEESFGILDCQDMKRPEHNLAINLIRKDSSDTYHFDHFHGTVSVAKEERKDIPVCSSIYVPQGSSLKTLPAAFQVEPLEYYFECRFIHSEIVFTSCEKEMHNACFSKHRSRPALWFAFATKNCKDEFHFEEKECGPTPRLLTLLCVPEVEAQRLVLQEATWHLHLQDCLQPICTGGQSMELKCQGPCGLLRALDGFSKQTRSNGITIEGTNVSDYPSIQGNSHVTQRAPSDSLPGASENQTENTPFGLPSRTPAGDSQGNAHTNQHQIASGLNLLRQSSQR
ncbi:HET-domain-containing protein [Hyaloscypha variabilis F]|uniref:HET-domain-containing protein n=1 Tax=Hyaloscypha variabilis (strain UAMH 11265 / GT02V1 / F) TaxID=1149755 RepID=A0A2J6R370_HYAVF|nr:HET-domain-containing protein [Hyaloscypha variabilis F]